MSDWKLLSADTLFDYPYWGFRPQEFHMNPFREQCNAPPREIKIKKAVE